MTDSEEVISPTDGQSRDVPRTIDPRVLIPALVIVAGVLVWGLTATPSFERTATSAFSWTMSSLGWLFILATTVMVFFVIWLGVSKYGRIILGQPGERPEYSRASWISMMFGAGMGIGLMFYGASEPLQHYLTPPPGEPAKSVDVAMSTTIFHWTIHPWSVYAVMGITIAYTVYRLGHRQLISAAFIPLVGEKRASGWLGKVIDILAIVATIFGTAASLGIGALQINAGIGEAGWISNPGIWSVFGVIVVLGLGYIVSAVSGISRGIKYLSNINMILAIALMILVFIAGGAAVTTLNLIPTSVNSYFANFFSMAGRSAATGNGAAAEWLAGNTVFYWAWWISWSPFVGLFLAKISRGRTIREFVVGVLVVPSVLSLIWFAVFGGAAIHFEQIGKSITSEGGAETQLFELMRNLPGTGILVVLVMVLVGIFFVTGADSASIVMGTLSQRGEEHPHRPLVVMWGVLAAAVALLLLIPGFSDDGDGSSALDSLQNITIIAASPFVLVLIGMCAALAKSLLKDPLIVEEAQIRKELRARHKRDQAGAKVGVRSAARQNRARAGGRS